MTVQDRIGQERAALGRTIVEAAYLEGAFVLSSGAQSTYYLDKYLFETRPEILRALARALADLLPDGIDRIAGTELGGVALATALSLETNIPFVIVRKGTKDYSTAKQIEGVLQPGERIAIVEDVITSGAQAIRAAQLVAAASAVPTGILAVVDREEGGGERIAEAGFPLWALFTRSGLGLR